MLDLSNVALAHKEVKLFYFKKKRHLFSLFVWAGPYRSVMPRLFLNVLNVIKIFFLKTNFEGRFKILKESNLLSSEPITKILCIKSLEG